MSEPSREGANTIKLAERRVFTHSFKPLYDEGMGLVEQAAEYLDGQGRAEAKKLSRLAATLYAAESMRLTTRLMQIASWLLLQRAANSGEMSRDQVAAEKVQGPPRHRIRQREASGWDELPEAFVELVQPLAQPAVAGPSHGRRDLRQERRRHGRRPATRHPTRSPTRSACSTRPSPAADRPPQPSSARGYPLTAWSGRMSVAALFTFVWHRIRRKGKVPR